MSDAPSRARLCWNVAARKKVLPWAFLIGLIKSTQFLFQPFVWRNWPVDEVLLGWFDVAVDNVLIAWSIGLALLAATRVSPLGPGRSAIAIAVAVVVGACVGQFALWAIGSAAAPDGIATLVVRVFLWCLTAGSFAVLYFLWRRSVEANTALRETELRRVQIEQLAVQVRVQALRSQIEPHFLFNTLATIQELHGSQPDKGASLLAHFIDYLRLMLPNREDGRCTLAQELDLIRAYLEVVSVRMSGRLRVSWEVPAGLDSCEFPPLVLATLVENAIKHGIGPAPGGGSLTIAARNREGSLEVTVRDTGVGLSGSGGAGIGLVNLRARLANVYGNSGRLLLGQNLPRGVLACVRLPLRTVRYAT